MGCCPGQQHFWNLNTANAERKCRSLPIQCCQATSGGIGWEQNRCYVHKLVNKTCELNRLTLLVVESTSDKKRSLPCRVNSTSYNNREHATTKTACKTFHISIDLCACVSMTCLRAILLKMDPRTKSTCKKDPAHAQLTKTGADAKTGR